MNTQYHIIPTEDGSHTIYLAQLDETYHSRHGAVEESLHVFIREGLQRLAAKPTITILEIGFGTGLNCLLTAMAVADTDQEILYCSIEPFPLQADITEQLNYTHTLPKAAASVFKAIHAAAWNEAVTIRDTFTLLKMETTLAGMLPLATKADLVYFDAFAPSKQPELWQPEALEKIKQQMHEGSILTTYCAQGQFKRNLKALGFSLQHPPGAGGKRQMTVAILNAASTPEETLF